ncbi:DUF397 domain-containing protein [Kitasatospora sp. NBC_01287]|uniref:DUF397 domain-containing protein n=1 Tax=Kitasatospora sp. NBC_01287 TaxID=2903573 RepID=UPI00225A16C1|nr:DUF397 domain-containing protein [Kitasatospora sp. NBC_01287]MCX4747264.1 DUF397 domain-containing protein [Kitasatospora sp. NBC_01287]
MDMSQASWRKSTYSQQQGACVEVADGFPGAVPVRDSKNPDEAALIFSAEGFTAFVAGVKAGAFGDV